MPKPVGQMITTFSDRFPFVGPIFWMISVQYYLVQVVVAKAWRMPYSWSHNTISDLGNSACGLFNHRFVCSPRFGLMNWSFISLGLTMILGSLLIYQEFKENKKSGLGFSAMALAGFGTVLVGLFPENTVATLHGLGAVLAFLIGNLALVLLGSNLDIPQGLRLYTILSGLIALMALSLYLTHHYAGLGAGGMERLTSYPQTTWLIVFGIYMSSKHIRAIRRSKASENALAL